MKKKNLFKNIYITLFFLFLYLPIIVLVIYSFNDSELNIVFKGFTLKWYKTLLENRSLLEALKNTLIVSITSTFFSTVIGTLSAIGLKKANFKFKKIINDLLYIPIVIPEIVLGIALLSIFTLTNIELGMFTIILSHIAFSIPFVIISVRGVLDNLNPYLDDACRDLGASDFKTLWYVTLPSCASGIFSGALLAFTLSLDDVIISYFTAGPGSNTLPLKIYSMIKSGITPDVNALSSIILLITIIILSISTIIEIRKIKRSVNYEK